jgi:hypothetical protein
MTKLPSLFLALLLPTGGHGLATGNNDNKLKVFVENALSNIIVQNPKAAAPEPSFLERINLQSNTEPKTFQFQFQQLPDLVTASFPVRTQKLQFKLIQ